MAAKDGGRLSEALRLAAPVNGAAALVILNKAATRIRDAVNFMPASWFLGDRRDDSKFCWAV
jgi:hypothetical protein